MVAGKGTKKGYRKRWSVASQPTEKDMKYITNNKGDKSYKADFNTKFFNEKWLESLCEEWTEEDNDGTVYYLAEV